MGAGLVGVQHCEGFHEVSGIRAFGLIIALAGTDWRRMSKMGKMGKKRKRATRVFDSARAVLFFAACPLSLLHVWD